MAFVRCICCKKLYYKPTNRFNESLKFRWNLYCSAECQGKFKRKGKIYKCNNPECKNKVYRTPSDLTKVKNTYCSTSCAAKINNLIRFVDSENKLTRVSIKKYLQSFRKRMTKKCLTCGRDYQGKRKYCSNVCIAYPPSANKGKSKYTKKLLIKMIKQFERQNDRIPMKREFTTGYAATRKIFGCWNNAIIAAGFEPNPVKFAKHYIAKDGHKCDSLAELIIDNYLTNCKINHEVHPYYPTNNKYKADFKVGKYFIEFFGLTGEHKKYDKLRKVKIKIAKKQKMDLIEIYPKNMFPKANLRELFSSYKEFNQVQVR